MKQIYPGRKLALIVVVKVLFVLGMSQPAYVQDLSAEQLETSPPAGPSLSIKNDWQTVFTDR